MTASRPLPWTLDRLVPRLYSAPWPDQPLTAQVILHAEAVTGTWTTSVISQQPRFVPFGEDGEPAGNRGRAASDLAYTLTLAPGGCYRLELTSGADATLDDDEDDAGDGAEEDDDRTDPWASAVDSQDEDTSPGDGTSPWRGYCGDGTGHWVVLGDRAERTPEPFLPDGIRALLWPSWLVAGWDLELQGTAEAAGRTALRVIATPGPLTRGRQAVRDRMLERVVVLADPDLPLLLSHEAVRAGRTDETTLITSLGPAPAGGGIASFRPSPSLPVTDRAVYGELFADLRQKADSPGWKLARSAAGALGEGLGFAVRHTPRKPPVPGTPAMPDPGPADSAAVPLSADLVNLLHRTGLPAPRFTALAATWHDGEGFVAAGQAVRTAAGPLAGLLGPGDVWAALADRPLADRYQAQRVSLSLPGRYRIDQISGLDSKTLLTEISDGEHRWAIYPNRVVKLPAAVRPLSDRWLRLADPSWLLEPGWELSAPRPVQAGGRDGWLLWAHFSRKGDPPGWQLASQGLLPQMCVVADAALGVLLRMTSCADGKPVMCTELTDLSVPPPGGDEELFTPVLPDGVPVISGRTALDELDIPAPVRAVFGAVSRVWPGRPPAGPA